MKKVRKLKFAVDDHVRWNEVSAMTARRNPGRKAPIREPERIKQAPVRAPGPRPKPVREPRGKRAARG